MDTNAPTRRVYPIEETRRLLGGISRKSIYDLINDGSLRTIKVAGRRLVPEESINELIQRSLEAGEHKEAA